MERCVFKHIHNYLLENNIIINNQSGFTKGDSAIYQLINITNDFGKALDEGKSLQRGDFKIWVASFNNLGLTASGPEALDMSNNFSISSTSFSKIASESRGSKQYWNVIKSLMNYDSTDS
jgi:hypothetical protein